MNKHFFTTMTAAALRDLDPAPARVLTDAERERADATFARILATPSHDPFAKEPGRTRRRRRRLLAPLGLVGAAVPALLLSTGSAFGSWTPTPEPLTGVSAAEAATTCRSVLQVSDQKERVVIAERRGGWTYVLFAGPHSEGACLMPEGLVDQQDPAAHRTEGFMGHYDSDPPDAPSLARGRITGYGGAGSVPTNGLWHFGDGEEWVSYVDGYVGSDVSGVTVHTPTGTDVEASVANGRFAAWWPSAKPSSENLEAMGAWTYTVTLADGTTRAVTS